MEEYIIERYDLHIIDKEDNTCSCSIEPKVGKAHNNSGRKIYIVKTKANEFLYIGEAFTKITTRMQRACTSYNHFVIQKKAKSGYKGYKWLDKEKNTERNLILYVATFNSDSDKTRCRIEAIEGELVYLVRTKEEYWPKYQNEIHFQNIEGTKEIAEKFFMFIQKPVIYDRQNDSV